MAVSLSKIANRTFGLPRSLHALGANVLLLPLGIANSVLIARTVGPAGKGNFDLILATAALLGTTLGLSLPPGITYVVAQARANLSAFAMQLLIVSAAQGLLAFTILAVLRLIGKGGYFLPATFGPWIVLAVAVYVWVETLTRFWAAILTGRQEIAIVNNSEVVGRVSQFFMLFALAGTLYLLNKRLSVPALLGVSFAANTLINLLIMKSLNLKLRLSPDTSALKAATSFALPCYLSNVAQFLNYRLDVFIVSMFAGAASLGRYTLAVSLAQLLWLMSNSFASVLLPKVAASNDPNQSVRHSSRVTRLALWASIVCGAALGLFASQAIPLFYGEPFRPSVAALWCILPGIVAFSMVNVLAAHLAGMGKPRLNLLVSCISLVFTITLDLLLIPKFDIIGAAIATTVSYSVSAVLTIYLFVRHTGAPLRDVLLPTGEDFKLLTEIAQPVLRRAHLLRVG
jgi:O-antigen/teichoic acid export membrane protein